MIQINVDTTEWKALAEWVRKQIAETHLMLEQPELKGKETQRLRGRIGALRDLLALPSRPSPPVAAPQLVVPDDYSPIKET